MVEAFPGVRAEADGSEECGDGVRVEKKATHRTMRGFGLRTLSADSGFIQVQAAAKRNTLLLLRVFCMMIFGKQSEYNF